MESRALFCLGAASILLAPIVAGCSEDAGAPNGANDASVGDVSLAPLDAGRTDARADGTSQDRDAPEASDGSVGPRGSQLVASNQITAEGVTSDGYAIYTDSSSNTLNAVSLAGGPVIPIGTVDMLSFPTISGTAVSFWTNNLTTLTVWTRAHGPQILSTTTSPIFPAISADSSSVLYVDSVTATGASGNIMVAGTNGTGKTLLVASVQVSNNACYPSLGFAGATALAVYCTGDGDAGLGDLSSFTGPTWTATTLATSVALYFLGNPTGTTVLATGSSGLFAYPLDGGASTLIDPAGALSFVFLNNGQDVLYTTGQALKRSPLATPQPVTLGPTGVSILEVSPDESWTLTNDMQNLTSFATDLYLESTTSPGPGTALVPTTTSYFAGNVFTTDSAYVAYRTNYGQGGSADTGTLEVLPVGGGSPRTVSTTVFWSVPTSGSKVVFNDHYVPQQPGNGIADIEWLDASQAAPPVLLVHGADAEFYQTATLDKIVYSWSYAPGPQAGLWVMPAP